jgi:hypothetical protein
LCAALKQGEHYLRDFGCDFYPATRYHENFSIRLLAKWIFTPPLVLGLKDFAHFQECEAFVAETHEKLMKNLPHYYMLGLTVDLYVKGLGIGSLPLKAGKSPSDYIADMCERLFSD